MYKNGRENEGNGKRIETRGLGKVAKLLGKEDRPAGCFVQRDGESRGTTDRGIEASDGVRSAREIGKKA